VDVEEHDVWPEPQDRFDSGVDVTRLRYDVDVRPELGANTAAEHRVVVDQHDAKGCRHRGAS
jgi:hypothetical protein